MGYRPRRSRSLTLIFRIAAGFTVGIDCVKHIIIGEIHWSDDSRGRGVSTRGFRNLYKYLQKAIIKGVPNTVVTRD